MALKKIYEMNNVAIGDTTYSDKYLIAMPEGYTEFPTKETKIPKKIRNFQTIVLGPKTIEVGRSSLDDLADEHFED